jgi:hypothetical protein
MTGAPPDNLSNYYRVLPHSVSCWNIREGNPFAGTDGRPRNAGTLQLEANLSQAMQLLAVFDKWSEECCNMLKRSPLLLKQAAVVRTKLRPRIGMDEPCGAKLI